MTGKSCSSCKRVLPLSAFGTGKKPHLYQSHCRECQAAKARDRRASRPGFQGREAVRRARAELAAAGSKQCGNPSCNKILPVEEFNVDKSRADGRYSYCKRCTTQVDAARRPRFIGPSLPVGYSGAHDRLPLLGRQSCCRCGRPAEEWAYDHGDPEELLDEIGRPYSLDQGHYQPMCRSCHRRFDSEHRKVTGTARPRKRKLKPCAVCQEPFWNPSHHRKTCSPECQTELRRRSKVAYEERIRSATGFSSNQLRGQTPLTAEAVRDIRTRHGNRSASARELARLYGISQSSIFRVINRESWRHVA